MALQQLQRPLTRSIAAAWRPGPFPALCHGSSRSRFSSSTRQLRSEPPLQSKKKSLFEELFPDEAKQRQQQAQSQPDADGRGLSTSISPTSSWVSQLLGPPPAVEDASDLGSYEGARWFKPSTSDTRDLRSMIVLSAASKHLAESDFYRVGSMRALHVEGWVSGITKVIPARDPDTLDPLGHYYVLFESRAAAEAWREEVKRLWELARHYTPGASLRKGKHAYMGTRPLASVGLQDQTVKEEVEGFTLVQPSQRWDLELARYTAAERAMEAGNSIFEQLCRRAGTQFLVLVAVVGGRISTETLRTAIRDDGMERRLAWRVKNLEGRLERPGEGGIMPFGKSVLKTKDKVGIEESLKEQGMRAMGVQDERERKQGYGKRLAGATEVGKQLRDESRRYPRFLLPFLDEAEARRFVRHWHRKQLILRMGHEDADVKGVKEWEETRVLNVSLLW
ncbi:hypothetical protein BJ170DRAFT_613319 [Xylariales sp. AK1849]|nr:hypothetical protein BJ170DRAFT_613319 [Xylariales sp. AK1849]